MAVTLMDDDAVKWVPVARGLSLSTRYAPRSQVLRHVSDCYRIVMLKFPSGLMTQVGYGY